MAFFSEFFKLASDDNLEQVVLCMPHRGRLNLLTGMLNFPPAKMFAKLKGQPDFPESYQCTGDVLSHCSIKGAYCKEMFDVILSFSCFNRS